MNVVPDYDKLCALLENFEGFKPIAYKDSGNVWTLGYGSTWNHFKNRKVMAGDFITKSDAKTFIKIDCTEILRFLNQTIKVELNKNQSAALVDYVYNRGMGNLLKTKIVDLINTNAGQEKIKNEILGTGLFDRLGHKLWGLGRRRRSEFHLYSTGDLVFDWKKWA